MVHAGSLASALVEDEPFGPTSLPLQSLVGRPMPLGSFFRLAIALADAVERLHGQGIVHTDLTPSNVLLRADLGAVSLTGLGVAIHGVDPAVEPRSPRVVAGSLAYMAPEQTRSMNRSIDARSDLYSLGVMFYELLSGALPFTARDPLEWLHCHVARAPRRLGDEHPSPLTDVVMKLLAKPAEDRYQTAASLGADLRRCQAEWASRSRIDPFPLGADDRAARPLVSGILYGRQTEAEILRTAFERVATTGKAELLLVSGPAGVGKSSVVNDLERELVPTRGLFAAGKFDQYQRDIPYAAVAQAFQGLVRQVLTKPDEELRRWREDLCAALEPNGQLMLNLVPGLELVVGEQPPLVTLSPQDEQQRFQVAFQRLMAVFARPEHPLVLFFDDLQWLDAATLELFARLLGTPDVRHVLLIGAYRDDELGAEHALPRALAALREGGVAIRELRLAPLGATDVERLLADTLDCTLERVRTLAALVHEKTIGNPFFVVQFTAVLVDERLLVYDRESAAWAWDVDRIRAKSFSDNVVALMLSKIERLSPATQHILKQLACLGSPCATATLARLREDSEERVHTAFAEAVEAGLVVRDGAAYLFLHDRIQEAAYRLIPEAERAAEHLRLGRLLSSLEPEQVDERVFEIVSQFNRGAALLDSQAERERVAELNLLAGRRARASTAFSSALAYLAAGGALLTEESWRTRYPLAFALELLRAECELLSNACSLAAERTSALARRAQNRVDQAAVACLSISLDLVQDEADRAVATLLAYLVSVGVHWSAEPSDAEVHAEHAALWRELGSRSIEELLDAPALTDAEERATLEVLICAGPATLFTAPSLFRVVACRMARLSIRYGNADASCLAYVLWGMVLGPFFGNQADALRFGQLGLELCEKKGLRRYRGRVLLCFGAIVMPWSRPLSTAETMVRTAFKVAEEAGDIEYAGYRVLLLAHLLASGTPLAQLRRDAERAEAFASKTRHQTRGQAVGTVLALVCSLQGESSSLGSLSGPDFDEERTEAQLSSDPRLAISLCRYWVRKLQARFYAADYPAALDVARRIPSMLWAIPSLIENADYRLFGALAAAACHDTVAPEERAGLLALVTEHHRQLAAWAAHCVENFGAGAQLVAAEMARLHGDDTGAMRLYEQAIALADRHGLIHYEALASELCANFHVGRGFERIGETYWRHARATYYRWGALGKVAQLDERLATLGRRYAGAASTVTIGTPLARLDVATVAKVSQALSGEIVLEALSEKLMRIAIEHAGAERGWLLMRRGEEACVEARASPGKHGVDVCLDQRPVSAAELPESLLNYVFRTREKVIVDDASSDHPFSADAYFAAHACRSLLCLPLVKQSALVGLLYLENNLAPRVFTPARTAVLELVASQAAISLENARLYGDLDRSQTELKSRLLELDRSEEARQRAEVVLAHVTRVTTVGELAASIAHEINQPLTAMVADASACLNWLTHERPDVAIMRESLEAIVRDGERAGQVLTRIRALLARSSVPHRPCDVAEVVSTVLPLLRPQLARDGIVLDAVLASDAPKVVGDPVQLQQVVLNLVLNGADSSREVDADRRRVVITSSVEEREGARWVVVAVKDAGIGLDAAGAARLFEPFYTTKPTGLGMGLTICRSIIERHGGRLSASPNPERGATFRFALPALEQP